eukprot:354523-Chlamydomonas_euryale.AAC.2
MGKAHCAIPSCQAVGRKLPLPPAAGVGPVSTCGSRPLRSRYWLRDLQHGAATCSNPLGKRLRLMARPRRPAGRVRWHGHRCLPGCLDDATWGCGLVLFIRTYNGGLHALHCHWACKSCWVAAIIVIEKQHLVLHGGSLGRGHLCTSGYVSAMLA